METKSPQKFIDEYIEAYEKELFKIGKTARGKRWNDFVEQARDIQKQMEDNNMVLISELELNKEVV